VAFEIVFHEASHTVDAKTHRGGTSKQLSNRSKSPPSCGMPSSFTRPEKS